MHLRGVCYPTGAYGGGGEHGSVGAEVMFGVMGVMMWSHPLVNRCLETKKLRKQAREKSEADGHG